MKPFKNSVFIFLISVFSIYSCQKAPAPLTEAEKEAISNEVKSTFTQLNAAMNSHNVNEIKKFFSNSDDFIYATSDNIFTNVEDLFNVISRTHSNPDLLPFNIEFNDINIRVLNNEYATLTGVGTVNSSIGTDNANSVRLTFTYLLKKTKGQWLTVVGHESTR